MFLKVYTNWQSKRQQKFTHSTDGNHSMEKITKALIQMKQTVCNVYNFASFIYTAADVNTSVLMSSRKVLVLGLQVLVVGS